MVAGQISSFSVVGAGAEPSPIRPLLRDLERSLADGELRSSYLGRDVYKMLQDEKHQLDLKEPFDSRWIIAGIRVSDEYFARIRLGAGVRDWQKDLAKTLTPILVSMTWSLERSPDTQSVLLRTIDAVAKKLRLRIDWPEDTDDSNDAKNSIYRACLDAGELECDWVLIALQGLKVCGPE